MGKRGQKTFGKAEDFYRARVITVEASVFPDFEWREDILSYPSPPDPSGRTTVDHRLEVVSEESGKSKVLSTHKTRVEAQKAKNKVDKDLGELTKIEFDKKYNLKIPPD